MHTLAVLSDANVDAPTNASVAFDHFVGLLILTVCVETVGSRLCSSYIYFVSSQYVSDLMTPSTPLFSLVLCLPVRRTQSHADLSYANVGVLGLTSCECSVGSLCWLILLTVWDETLALLLVFGLHSAHLHRA